MSDHVKIAADHFVGGCNCAQALVMAYRDEMGLDEKQAMRIASSFGGGIGRLREVCGAMSGALMVLGCLKGYDIPGDQEVKLAHYEQVQDYAARFKKALGVESYNCRDILAGIDVANPGTPIPQTRDARFYATRPCLRCVEVAAGVLDEMLGE